MMSGNIQRLRTDLEQIRKVLDEGGLLAHAPELERSLTLGVVEMLEKVDRQVEENLVVGLLGGTGVGKSTLMNALAGRSVASASHRRPHTDQILLYRHVATALPSAVTSGVTPLREITHDVDAIAQIVLCDLPDFDSIVPAHRRRVLDFLSHLDLLVWVATPEKYADGGFYDFLADVPKAGRNCVFVLNKADLLFESVPLNEGYERLSRVSELFAQHLTSNGMESPIVHCVSAAQPLEGISAAPWNQFPAFRDLLFQRRELKEIAAIKSANLDVEKSHLLRSLEEEVLRVRSLVEALGDVVNEIERGRSEWRDAGRRAIGRWTRSLPLDRMAGEQGVRSLALSGPALLIAGFAERFDRQGSREWRASTEADFSDPRGPLAGLRRELDRLEDRMAYRVLQAGLPQVMVEEGRSVLTSEDRWLRLVRTLEQKTEGLLASSFAVPRKGFRFFQRVVYGVVYILFMASLLRGEHLSAVVREPSWSAMAPLLLDLLLSLFNTVGLTALGSLAFLQLFLGWRFYRRHKKWLQQRTQRFIETLEQDLVRVWENELEEMGSACRQAVARKEAAITAFDGLRGTRREE